MITFNVTGAGNVALALTSAQLRVRGAVRQSVLRNTLLLVAYVKEHKLSGQVLKNRTGRLRRSVTPRTTETKTRIAGQAGTNVEYAAGHEYGVKETVQVQLHTVKAHWRQNVTKAFGKDIPPRSVFIQAHAVRAHAMRMNLPERSFLRSALRDLSLTITGNLHDDITAALEGRA